MSASHSLFESIADSFVPIHRDGHKFLAIAGGASLLAFVLAPTLGWILAIITAWVAYFFRDPERVTPVRDGLIISAADGRVSSIEKIRPPPELGLGDEERTRISVFLSIFNVHIQRAPVAGKISRSIYVPGAFLNAALDKASDENERNSLVIVTPAGVEIAVVQIAGLIARRILTFSSQGDNLGIGERFGLIRFGSRVDVFLPPGHDALVAVGQLAIAGETVLADLRSEEPEREARQG